MIFYTSDWHLGHGNIIKFCNRPFQSTEEMDQAILKNYNDTVSPNDAVYILGDLMSRQYWSDHPADRIAAFNGHKHLIVGNHDRKYVKAFNKKLFAVFESIDDYLEISDKGKKVILFHYPILEWNQYFSQSYHIFGHIHNGGSNDTAPIMQARERAFNACVDVNDMKPVTLDELIWRNGVEK